MGRKAMNDALHENGHEFVRGIELGLRALQAGFVFRECGIVRRSDGKNSQCRGRVKIGLRAEAIRAEIKGE